MTILRTDIKNREQRKVAVVTGGARGIGKCIADEFRKQNVKVYVIDKTEGDHYEGDISDKAVLEDFVEMVIRECGGVDYPCALTRQDSSLARISVLMEE